MFGRRGTLGSNGSADPGEDPVLGRALQVVDPGSRDGTYWMRFHRDVMNAVAGELARRRRVVGLTVGDFMVSWSRTLVPAAMLAAAVAAFLMLRPFGSEQGVYGIGIEELLAEGIVAPTASSVNEASISFASEIF